MVDFDAIKERFSPNSRVMVRVINRDRTAEVVAIWRRGWLTVKFDSGMTTDIHLSDVELINETNDEK